MALAKLKAQFKRFIGKRFDNWLQQRMPGSQTHTLSNRNIFIFPTKFGFSYLFFVLLLFLLGTNYQNNIVILLSYLLASFFLTCMLHSFFNFSGLTVSGASEISGFAQEDILMPIKFTTSQQRHQLVATIEDYKPESLSSTQQSKYLDVNFYAKTRGAYDLPRVKIASEYAFGLFTTWTRLDFACQCTIFPAPIKVANFRQQNMQTKQNDMELGAVKPGIEDFAELKQYQRGESLSRVAWKQFARGQGRFTKHYQEGANQSVWLDINQMPSTSIEERLGMLCFLALEYSNTSEVFGLELGQQTIEPSSGPEHLKACLTALAKYPISKGGT